VADDLGWGDVGAYGGTTQQTPHLDRLAAQGVRFTDFHVCAPACRPSRLGLLSGRHPAHFGVLGNFDNHPRSLETNLARWLTEAGYVSGLVGKWHLGFDHHPLDHGFESFRGFLGGNIDYQSHVSPLGKRDWWNGRREVEEEGYTTRLVTQHAMRFIEQHKDQPFFLFVSQQAPHGPYQGPGDPALRRQMSRDHEPAREDIEVAYAEMVTELDRSLGEIVGRIESLGLAQDTVVVFVSDNGPAPAVGSSGPWRGRKADLYEGGHRVPALVWAPGRMAGGSVRDDTVSSLDIAPSFLELAGVDPTQLPLDGRPDLFVPEDGDEREFFWDYQHRGDEPRLRAVRHGRWVLIVTPDGDELYDLVADPAQKRDVIDTQPAAADDLRRRLERWSAALEAER
jgi:arylsulfatase A-like enzyme